jgi:hypothetical protein
VYPVLFTAAHPRPSWVPTRPWDGIAELAAGMVLARSGGPLAVLAYVLLELAILAANIPVRSFTCGRRPTSIPSSIACDFPGMVAERWPLWLALVLGVGLYRLLGLRTDGPNVLLRAAGAFGLVITVASTGGAVWYYTRLPIIATDVDVIVLVGTILAGLAADALLWRTPLARPLLLGLLVVGPGLAFSVPVLRANLPAPAASSALLFQIWAPTLTAIAGAAAIIAGRAARELWGTFS